MKKNIASQVIGCQMISSTDGSNFTGAVTVYITGDGGTQAQGIVSSGLCTHEGNGYHTYVPDITETNYDHIAFTFMGTGALTTTVQVFTVTDSSGVTELLTRIPDATPGASGGLLIAGSNADTTVNIIGSIASVGAGGITTNSMATNSITAASLSAAAVAKIQAGMYGAGAVSWTYTVTDSVTGLQIDGVEVWVSTDILGASIVASGNTDSYGVVTFMLDAGTVYVWRKHSGYTFSNPDTETVVA